MADKIRIDDENDFSYNVTDSEEDYSEGEKELLEEVQKCRRKEKSQVEDVMAFTETESEDDDDDVDGDGIYAEEDAQDMADSDIEGARESDLNDEESDTKYWGKTKRNYYNTDFVDQDYSSYNEKEEELAKMEEEEANNIRLRLIKELKEEDFLLDSLSHKLSKGMSTQENQVMESTSSTLLDDTAFSSVQLKADFTKLSKRERLQLFEKDAPEFAALIGDLENYLDEIRQIHNPVLEYCRQNDVPMIPALKFAQHYQNIVLTYCNNLMFYLLLKCTCTASVQHHPVIKRLNQLKKLLNQLDDKHENIIKPQLEALLERINDGDNFKVLEQTDTKVTMSTKKMKQELKKSMNKKKVQFMENGSMKNMKYNNQCENDDDDSYADNDENNLDKNDFEENIENDNVNDDNNSDDNLNENDDDGNKRRDITYEIAKNKGLMPQRKKEQRNPRVKHRGKYRKALIRRKGAIRNVRKEMKRYDGEISGIKATVSKSIKFKT